jgi:hypothetical protein
MHVAKWLTTLCTALALGLLLTFCGKGGSEDRVLRLPGADVTESDLRDQLREQLDGAPGARTVICDAIEGAKSDQVLAYFELDVESDSLSDSQLADLRRAAQIIQEECTRNLSAS